MQIIISGKGVKLTDAIEDYVNKKINGLDKFFKGIIRVEVVVGLETQHHNKGEIFFAECKTQVPGHELFAKKTDKTLYSAIDAVRDYLETELKKHKAKLRGNNRRKKTNQRDQKEYHNDND